MSILAAVLILACTPFALLDFAIPKWKAQPAFRIDDAYKWTYQATRGGEHAAPSRDAAKSWLDNEWSSLAAGPKGEAEWTALCPGGEIGRLNLRPFKARGGSADDLVDAFLASAAEFRSEPKDFTDAWTELGKRLKKKGFASVTYKEWIRLDAEMKKKGYPAIHHSKDYNEALRPAYRVLTMAEAAKILKH